MALSRAKDSWDHIGLCLFQPSGKAQWGRGLCVRGWGWGREADLWAAAASRQPREGESLVKTPRDLDWPLSSRLASC